MLLREVIEEVAAPHREFDVAIETRIGRTDGAEPVFRRNPGILYGLGNIVENAVDFARKEVRVDMIWDSERVAITVTDDGPGFAPEQLEKLGEPDLRMTRGAIRSRKGGSGMGLGVFIAKTLLERSGARLKFANSAEPGEGAKVTVSWLRASMDTRGA